jgi:hypothetical protein
MANGRFSSLAGSGAVVTADQRKSYQRVLNPAIHLLPLRSQNKEEDAAPSTFTIAHELLFLGVLCASVVKKLFCISLCLCGE